jgi:hypothetical protein
MAFLKALSAQGWLGRACQRATEGREARSALRKIGWLVELLASTAIKERDACSRGTAHTVAARNPKSSAERGTKWPTS